MKNSALAVRERQKIILEKLSESGEVLIESLKEELGVSALTIRRDFGRLEECGLLERTYGGAKIITGKIKKKSNLKKEAIKERIAKRAATFVQDSETILVNSSSTAYYLFNFLAEKQITIITNNADALTFADRARYELIFIGGELNIIKHSMVGPIAMETLKSIRATKCFMGVSGITKEGVLSTAMFQEADVNKMMIEQATSEVIVLAESEKIGVQSNFDIASLKKVRRLITDSAITEEQRHIIESCGSELISV